MEDYEEFCKKQLARIQGETIQEAFLPAQHKSISVIQFHGVAVLSPLLTLEKRKKMEHYRQKALALDESRQNIKKRTLLTRVQEILETVQVRKVSSVSDLDEASENIQQNSESKPMNGFTILPNIISLPAFAEQCRSAKLEKTMEKMSLDTDAQCKSTGTSSVKGTDEYISPKQIESPNSHSEKNLHTNTVSPPNITQDRLSLNLDPTANELDEPPPSEEAPDPYMMSLQNLLKKSREYIEREHGRHSTRNATRNIFNDIHSNKEHESFKISDSIKEKERFMGRSRSCSPVALDKPSLNKSNILLQGASSQINSINATTLSSFSKVDIPMRSGTPPALEDEFDDLKNNSMLDYDSGIVKSFTGSYAQLPSPEPSLSPKMHRRRPRPLSMGHIVINNPVNAYELSPNEKGRAAGLIVQHATENMTVSEPVPKFAMNETASNKGHVVNKNAVEVCDLCTSGKPNQPCQHEITKLENRVINVKTTVEGHMVTSCRETHNCNVPVKYHEPYATSQFIETQNLLPESGPSSNGLTEKVKRSSPVELNKSYDVETPSPILMQNQNVKQQIDTPNVSCLWQQCLESSYENKVKRRLDLDIDSPHKENNPFGELAVGMVEQEKRWLQEQRGHPGSAYINTNETSVNSTIREEILTKKMLAFEEMRKKLEEQHAQQLSLLIAEQEREQEKLHKEIEQQERRLKEKKLDGLDSQKMPTLYATKGMDLEWRKISEGFANVTAQNSFSSPREPPFYLWGPASSGMPKTTAPRSLGRTKIRWSQVYTSEMQIKFCKVTAVVKGFLTRRLLQTDKLKHLRQTVKDTVEFMKVFQSELPLKRAAVSTQDASLQERVLAQLRAALYEIHDIFFRMEVLERMHILCHDREVRREKMIRQLEKVKSPRERMALSAATQKSLDRKKMKAIEMGMPNKKTQLKQKALETRILQPNQGQNTPLTRLFYRQGSICRKNPKKEAKCCDNLRRQHSLG
ncbi:centriolar coiled-coil protein of 110 kDa isoform X2 [Microcaecilia unicolor]|uniref:Centriolar coiled-coil protein of 110 kDa isoform X2 n=1 Tax=Microcaecilia unicolor TaxID=1415580 RepID=A0A6P7Z083_9AMPH|nr:centriolar coiled-coil protein of 110 kDa isoform X2 [Microcaecilia unicolor]